MTSTTLPTDLDQTIEDDRRYRAYRERMLREMPDEEHLVLWLLDVLGVWIPHRQVCDGHSSPLRYFMDRYYGYVLNTILWAARYCSKSFMAGLECWMKGRDRDRPYWQANICAGSGAQAERVYEATDIFWSATDDIAGRAVLKRDPLKSVTEFVDGSKYEITTASTKSQRGPHPNALFGDEIDEMPRDVFKSAMFQTMDRYGHKASTALLSTMHKVGGLMSEWVDHHAERGYKLYTHCILETMEPCSGDFRCDECSLEPYCMRRLKTIFAEEEERQQEQGLIQPGDLPRIGYNSIETMRQKVMQGFEKDTSGRVRILDIEAELFCRRPSRTGLVFPDFRDGFHVVPAQEISIQTEWRKARTTDFGFSAPFVDLYCAITPRDQVIVYGEFVQTGLTMPDIIDHLRAGRRHTAFLTTYADPAGKTEIETIRRAGIRMEEVVREVVEGIQAITNLLRMNIDGQPGLIISSDCPITIDQIKKLSYPENKPDSENWVKKDDHCVEALSRLVVAFIRGAMQPLDELLKGVHIGERDRDSSRPMSASDKVFQDAKRATRKVRKVRGGRGRERTRTRPGGVSDYL